MVFDRTKEPKFGEKIKVTKTATFYNAMGMKQAGSQPANAEVTVFEAKEINGTIFYRIGGQTQWIKKENTDRQVPAVSTKKPEPNNRFTNTDLSQEITIKSSNEQKETDSPEIPKQDAEKYDLTVKKGLAIQKGSSVPTAKEIRKIFKDGNKFPENTQFSWIYAPDTEQNKYTNAKVKVIFPDGSSKEHSVHYNVLAPKKPQIKQPTPVQPPLEKQNISQNTAVNFVNPQPRDLNFSFIKTIPLLKIFDKNMDEVLKLYQQAYYKQMSNTIRQGLELLTDQLLKLNRINPGEEWSRANLSNQLGYIAFLKLLPQRIMNLCFSIKNYGNIGSHHNTVAQFNQASALADLQQYHDLLAYLANTYQNSGSLIPYADVQITDEQSKHANWYKRPQILPAYLTFEQYMNRKNNPVQPTQAVYVQPTQAAPEPQITQPPKEKMGTGMKIILALFAILGIALIGGIGYEFYHMQHNGATQVQSSKPGKTLQEQADSLSAKQTVALSLVYADMKLGNTWEDAYQQVIDNDYNIDRYQEYTFGNATVSAQGNNYVYVVEKDIGLGYQDKGSHKRMVTFFDPDHSDSESNPEQKSTYQMLKAVKDAGEYDQVEKVAKKLNFTDNEQS